MSIFSSEGHTSQREGATLWLVTLCIYKVICKEGEAALTSTGVEGTSSAALLSSTLNPVLIVIIRTSHQQCQAWVTSR